MKEDPKFVTALARGLDVLKCFTPERMELGTTDIARLTGMPQPTVWRVCYTLTKLGYLIPGKDPERLRAGPAVLSLGVASIIQAGIAEMAYPLMAEISERFDASVSLAARQDLQMIIVQRAEAANILRLNFHIGSLLPLERSAVGAAYLAGVSQQECGQLLAMIKEANPAQWEDNRRYLEDSLHHYQEKGYVVNLGRSHPDVNALGVPVIGPGGRRIMAMNCGGSSSVVTRDKLAGPIAEAAKAVAARLSSLLT